MIKLCKSYLSSITIFKNVFFNIIIIKSYHYTFVCFILQIKKTLFSNNYISFMSVDSQSNQRQFHHVQFNLPNDHYISNNPSPFANSPYLSTPPSNIRYNQTQNNQVFNNINPQKSFLSSANQTTSPSHYYSPHRTQQSISQIYQQRKNQYTNRIRRLQDYTQINYPDKAKYIGQVLQLDEVSKDKNQQNIIKQKIYNKSKQKPLFRNGQGILFYPTGDVYFGGWKNELFNGQGVYIFSTGQIYDGLLKDSKKDGTGTYYYENNTSFYSGCWQNDQKNGSGLLNTPTEYYEGEWKNGIKHGNGYYKNKVSRTVYVGEFFEGIKQGKGRMVYPDGSVYAGELKNQLPHGVGDFQYPNKDKYIGQFIEGKKHGKGNYFFSQGTIFSGLWNDDTKSQGQLTLFNGDIFNGCFKENQRYQGTYRYRNGDVYEGTWKDDVKEGFGKLYLQNGQIYQGQFSEGQKHGSGIYKWKNGDKYEGQFLADKREGLGEYYWSEGGFYKGEWKAERMNGFGRLVKDGVDVIGQFFQDHFERAIEEYELGLLKNFVLS